MDEANLTDRELDAMKILWKHGSGTVGEILDRFPDPVAYTTVLWLLQTLEEKGHVSHTKEGRAFRYYPRVPEAAARGGAVERLIDRVFDGSAEMLINHLVFDRLSAEELEVMRQLLDRRLGDLEDK